MTVTGFDSQNTASACSPFDLFIFFLTICMAYFVLLPANLSSNSRLLNGIWQSIHVHANAWLTRHMHMYISV